jgi:hypothetical protein
MARWTRHSGSVRVKMGLTYRYYLYVKA